MKPLIPLFFVLCTNVFAQAQQLALIQPPIRLAGETSSKSDANNQILTEMRIVTEIDSLRITSAGVPVRCERQPGLIRIFMPQAARQIDCYYRELPPLTIDFAKYRVTLAAGSVWQLKLGFLRNEISGQKIATKTKRPVDSLQRDGFNIVYAKGVAPMTGLTYAAAFAQAKKRARIEGIQKAVGIQVYSEKFRRISETIANKKSILTDYFTNIDREVSFGQIVEEEVLRDTLIRADFGGLQPELYVQVDMRLKVATEKIQPDPAFVLSVETIPEGRFLREHDELKFRIRCTQDCWLTIFNLTANDSLMVLFPNIYARDNFLPAGKTIELMPPGFAFEAQLLPGLDQIQEVVYIVATKKRVVLPFFQPGKDSDFRQFSLEKFAHVRLPKWLSGIRPDERTTFTFDYTVYKAE